MAYSFSQTTVQSLIQRLVVMDFAAQGELAASVPLSTAAKQYVVDRTSPLPLTVVHIGNLDDTRHEEINAKYLCLPITIEHIRRREANSNAENVAVNLLAHLASTIENDYRLRVLTPTVEIQNVEVHEISTSESTLQLSDAMQGITIGRATLSLTVTWFESRL